jgi:hypothetical protein
MHTQYPKIKEDNELSKVLSAKQNLETRCTPKWGTNLALPSGKYAQPSFQDSRRYNLSNIANR